MFKNLILWRNFIPVENMKSIIVQICNVHFVTFLQNESNDRVSSFLQSFLNYTGEDLIVIKKFPTVTESLLMAIEQHKTNIPAAEQIITLIE